MVQNFLTWRKCFGCSEPFNVFSATFLPRRCPLQRVLLVVTGGIVGTACVTVPCSGDCLYLNGDKMHCWHSLCHGARQWCLPVPEWWQDALLAQLVSRCHAVVTASTWMCKVVFLAQPQWSRLHTFPVWCKQSEDEFQEEWQTLRVWHNYIWLRISTLYINPVTGSGFLKLLPWHLCFLLSSFFRASSLKFKLWSLYTCMSLNPAIWYATKTVRNLKQAAPKDASYLSIV